MPRPGRRYSPEFRAEAVRLLSSGDKSIAEVARELGVSEPTLRRWRLQAGEHPGKALGPEPEDPRRAEGAVPVPPPSMLPVLHEGEVRGRSAVSDRGRDRSVRRLARATAGVIDVGVAVVTWPARWVANGLRRYADQTDEPPGAAPEGQDGDGPVAAG